MLGYQYCIIKSYDIYLKLKLGSNKHSVPWVVGMWISHTQVVDTLSRMHGMALCARAMSTVAPARPSEACLALATEKVIWVYRFHTHIVWYTHFKLNFGSSKHYLHGAVGILISHTQVVETILYLRLYQNNNRYPELKPKPSGYDHGWVCIRFGVSEANIGRVCW